jgi:tRNA-2-methylthio-N6-dimethylallyladenosine synthase
VRGDIRLRSPEDILAEVKRSVEDGATKITLLGQNVNDYLFCSDRSLPVATYGFLDLLKMVVKIDGIKEIDFISAHPKNTSIELFEFMASEPKIKKYLHLPFQSGSDKILSAMNRGYTREFYLKLAHDYRRITGGKMGTDVIVGFPGETDEDFQATYDLIEEVGFEYYYLFMYSPRPHSAAQKMVDDVPQEVKHKRHSKLLELQKKIIIGIKKRENR